MTLDVDHEQGQIVLLGAGGRYEARLTPAQAVLLANRILELATQLIRTPEGRRFDVVGG